MKGIQAILARTMVFTMMLIAVHTAHAQSSLNVTNASTTNAPDRGVFKMAMDQKTGECAFISLDQKFVTLRNTNGTVVWSKNIVEHVPNIVLTNELESVVAKMDIPKQVAVRIVANFESMHADPKISSIEFSNDQIFLRVGFNYVTLEKRTGDITSCEAR